MRKEILEIAVGVNIAIDRTGKPLMNFMEETAL